MNQVLRKERRLSPEMMECSKMSIISSISNFIETVCNMNASVLVPCKLLDLESNINQENVDLYALHSLLNQLKDELLLGRLEDNRQEFITSSSKKAYSSPPATAAAVTMPTKDKCTESDDGFSSLNSFSRCCTDDESSDTDSELFKCETKDGDYSSPQCLLSLFRLHIQGLHSTLARFTEYANHVSQSYQENSGGS